MYKTDITKKFSINAMSETMVKLSENVLNLAREIEVGEDGVWLSNNDEFLKAVNVLSYVWEVE